MKLPLFSDIGIGLILFIKFQQRQGNTQLWGVEKHYGDVVHWSKRF